MRYKDLFYSFVIFIGFFLFFFLRNHYYQPSILEIIGQMPGKSDYVFSWDSGKGYNQSETLNYNFDEKNYNEINLPQLGLREIEISGQKNFIENIQSLRLKVDSSEIDLVFNKSGAVVTAKIPTKKIEKFSNFLVLIQIFLAFILAWLFYEFLGLKKRFQKNNWQEIIKYIFYEEKHWVFWLMFFGAVSIFTIWLLGQWPGAPNADTFDQLFQTKSLILKNDHPYISTLYLLSLMQFYDSFVTVAIFQIIITSALICYVLYFTYKNGVKYYLILPIYIFFIFSIPVGLYNITIWKDIPFSLLVVFWGFYLYYLGFQQKKGVKLFFSFKKILILSFLFILMVLIRHNGYLYMLILPAMLVTWRLMNLKTFTTFVGISILLLIFLKLIIPSTFHIQRWSQAESNTAWKIHPMAAMIMSDNYRSNDVISDKKILDDILNYDKNFIQLYNPYNGAPLVGYYGLAGLSQNEVKIINQLFYKMVIDNPILILSERSRLYSVLLFPNKSTAFVWDNFFLHLDEIKNYTQIWESGSHLYIQYQPIKKINFIEQKIINYLYVIKPVIFNLLYPSVILLIILFFYKQLPLSARSSLFILAQLPFWFIFIISPSIRYLYYVYLYYFIAIPLLCLEINFNKKIPNIILNGLYIVLIIPFLAANIILLLALFGVQINLITG